MELVYLWVEKYKNIEKQGFNFSPKFRCKYNPNTNELRIEENPNYVPLFPDNINITAIVGKNGSGKSSVFKSILMLIFYNKFKELSTPSVKMIAKERILHSNLKDFMAFLILKEGENFYKLDILIDKIKNNTQIHIYALTVNFQDKVSATKKIHSDNINFFTIYYNYMLDILKDGIGDEFIDLVYHRVDRYETPILIEPYKYRDKIDISNLRYLSSQKFANIFRLGIKNEFIKEFFIPNFVKIKINSNKISKKLEKYREKFKVSFSDLIHTIINILNNYKDSKRYEKFNKIYIALKLLEKQYNEICDCKQLENILFNSDTIENLINSLVEFIKIDEIEKKIKTLKVPLFEVQKILNAISFHKSILNGQAELFYKNLNQKVKIDTIKNVLKYLPPWVDIEYFENDKSFSSLSSGEKMVFSFMINLMYQVNNAKDKYQTINLFLDETELALHPEWQKKYIDYIIKTLKIFKGKIKINIIIATHSPFIISDLSKENIIFLDKDENGKCKVVDGLNEKKETFGANIHTLLSDSFFMEDGLMGEFAKSKINEIIDFLNDKKTLNEISIKEKEIIKIIEYIGEPFLKQKLLDMYYKKFEDEALKRETKEKLLAEKRRIEEELKKYD